jgi:putative heme-binding domain-containing protein
MSKSRSPALVALALLLLSSAAALGQIAIPRQHDKPPGPALTPEQALKKMTVPEGFTVELVASEPDVVNPVAMAIDERGRFWVTESFEYPRREPGPGRDRVKILEDTDADGKADKVTVFAEGLNIPSGIAVGYGGVWVANSPDLLFLQDTDGDGKADKSEVVVTGFGRTDTHELPNSLTWGPDGWLYGLNGVFNYSHVKYPETSPHYKKDHPGWQFTCALFRIHPRTREFQLFCEGVSNPWGVAFDNEGSAFISACVIDHLWHLTETGYYIRQGGPYPPHTWPLPSIVKHKHQKAAYCGIHYFDSDAYPEQYRNKLYMGNIHGGCINSDKLKRDGSTYFGTPEPDFLTANDAWFMPVVQKTGPDGCLYVLDWYDRYHCYQDANADPKGIDRGHGRLYRVRYKDTPYAKGFDLGKETDKQLIERLNAGNDFIRHTAQRLLNERMSDPLGDDLARVALDDAAPRQQRLHALWALGSDYHDRTFYHRLLGHKDPAFRAWGVRLLGNAGSAGDEKAAKVLVSLANDESPDVKLQVAIAARKLKGVEAMPFLMEVLANAGDDKLIPNIVWQNVHPLLETQSEAFITAVAKIDASKSPGVREILPRAIDRILATPKPDPVAIATIFAVLSTGEKPDLNIAGKCLAVLRQRVQSGELAGEQLATLKQKLAAPLGKIMQEQRGTVLHVDAVLLATCWKDKDAVAIVRDIAGDHARPAPRRLQAIDALITAGDAELLDQVQRIFGSREGPDLALRAAVVPLLARLDDPAVAPILLNLYDALEAEFKPRVIEVLTSRKGWSKDLLTAIDKQQLPATALNANQVRKLLSLGDKDLAALVTKTWGSVRTERDPLREGVILSQRTVIRSLNGDPHKGQELFKKLCGQCHKMHGEGQEVGPDITVNGRGNFEQLLSNVFDPSLVIGASYQARTVVTEDGRVLSGLLVEDNDQRIVLKQQGGKLETIARKDVDEVTVSPLSLMPEGIEKQYPPQEIADLFAFLTLDKPPSDATARKIPGTVLPKPRNEQDPKKYGEILDEMLPGFATAKSGVDGLGLLEEYRGRPYVVRTHPVERNQPCVLLRKVDVPANKRSRLALGVSHHGDPVGDWKLVVKVNGKPLHEEMVSAKTVTDGWLDLTVDLTPFAGKTIDLELLNQATDWNYEFGYWSRAEVISE